MLLLVVDFSIALNLSIASYHKCAAVTTGTPETISWGKCFYSTQPELRFCCTMETTSWSKCFCSTQPELWYCCTLETPSLGKCFHGTQPELWYCCTMEASSFWSRSFHSSQPEYYEFIRLVCWVTHKGSVLSPLWAGARTGRMCFQPRFERYLGR